MASGGCLYNSDSWENYRLCSFYLGWHQHKPPQGPQPPICSYSVVLKQCSCPRGLGAAAVLMQLCCSWSLCQNSLFAQAALSASGTCLVVRLMNHRAAGPRGSRCLLQQLCHRLCLSWHLKQQLLPRTRGSLQLQSLRHRGTHLGTEIAGYAKGNLPAGKGFGPDGGQD